MEETMERDIATLSNLNAGFVARRDAARRLGDGARAAYRALEAHRDDRDAYVRSAIDSALSGLPEGVAESAAQALDASSPEALLKSLAEACANGTPPEPHGDGYAIQWSLQGGRKQRVYLSSFTDRDGRPLVRVFTYCGESSESAKDWVLKSNAKLLRCAFALHQSKGKDYLILIHNLVAGEATPDEARRTVEEIASHGDWLESKLSGMDAF